VLTYWGIAFYFLFASIHTFSYARWNVAALDSWPRPLQALHAFYYTTITTYPFLVTIVYWGLIYGPATFSTEFSTWSNISEHGMNSLFALIEIFLTRTDPSPWIHILWSVAVMSLYLALAYITKATKGFYPYTFLDPSIAKNGMVAAYVFGIAVGIIIVTTLVHGLIWVRRWLTERKLGFEGKYARSHGATSATSSWRDEQEHEMGSPRAYSQK
jgi:hypothetical protein